MIKSHFAAVEQSLLALSQIAANTGHTLHRGTPREFFLREFLEHHVSRRIAFGTGEIISSDCEPRGKRNQFDVILYRPDYPKISIGGGIDCFVQESVIATIEVKSLLTEEELATSIRSASNAKALQGNFLSSAHAGYVPPGILSFVVAYEGPAKMETVADWIERTEAKEGLNRSPLPAQYEDRLKCLSESVEGVFVLGKGMCAFDNNPLTLLDQEIERSPDAKWFVVDQKNDNLLWLFLTLSAAVQGFLAKWVDWEAYMDDYQPEVLLR